MKLYIKFFISFILFLLLFGSYQEVFAGEVVDETENNYWREININLDGGSSGYLSYCTTVDRDGNGWKKDHFSLGLSIGQTFVDREGALHTIEDRGADEPRFDSFVFRGDAVGVTPYVIVGNPIREGYTFDGWSVSISGIKTRTDLVDGCVAFYIGPYDSSGNWNTSSFSITARWKKNLLDTYIVDYVREVDEDNELYYVYIAINNMIDASSLDIYCPTWTSESGQDDIEWIASEYGNWSVHGKNYNHKATLYRRNHNYELDNYMTHIYVYNEEDIVDYTALDLYSFTHKYVLLYEGNGAQGSMYNTLDYVSEDLLTFHSYSRDTVFGKSGVNDDSKVYIKDDKEIYCSNDTMKCVGESYTFKECEYIRKNYIFLGWDTDPYSNSPKYMPGNQYSNLGDDGDIIRLYAIWEHIKIEFDANGGIIPDSGNMGTKYIQETYGSGLSDDGRTGFVCVRSHDCYFDNMENDIPTKDGYIFMGWFDSLSEDATQVYGSSGHVVESKYWKDNLYQLDTGIKVYAHWIKGVRITFDANGGVIPNNGNMGADLIFYSGGLINLTGLADDRRTGWVTAFYNDIPFLYMHDDCPLKDDYMFLGWFDSLENDAAMVYDKTGSYCEGKYWKNGYLQVNYDFTVYARWVKQSFDIRLLMDKPDKASSNVTSNFVENNGWIWSLEGYYYKTVSLGEECTFPNVNDCFSLTGWTGTGWESVNDSETIVGNNDTIVCEFWLEDGYYVEYKSVWIENIYYILFDSNGGDVKYQGITANYEDIYKLPVLPERPGYTPAFWKAEYGNNVLSLSGEAEVSKLVSEDGGSITFIVAWDEKKKVCLRIASSSYDSTLVNAFSRTLESDWYNRIGNMPYKELSAIDEGECVQIWNVKKDKVQRVS